MTDIPKWQKDLTDILHPGADVNAYWNLRTFMASQAELEGVAQADFFNMLDKMARIFRKAGCYDERGNM
jgi:hypothetical protein